MAWKVLCNISDASTLSNTKLYIGMRLQLSTADGWHSRKNVNGMETITAFDFGKFWESSNNIYKNSFCTYYVKKMNERNWVHQYRKGAIASLTNCVLWEGGVYALHWLFEDSGILMRFVKKRLCDCIRWISIWKCQEFVNSCKTYSKNFDFDDI